MALYASHLIKEEEPLKALQLYIQYGAPPNPQVLHAGDVGARADARLTQRSLLLLEF